eukprot:2121261-Prymnesium_polylepis.1
MSTGGSGAEAHRGASGPGLECLATATVGLGGSLRPTPGTRTRALLAGGTDDALAVLLRRPLGLERL